MIPARTPTVLAGRRKLLMGGAAAGPVLFAASTRSALAVECRSPSQVFSGNLSQPGPSDCTAGGPPSVWKQYFRAWKVLKIDPPAIEIRNGNGWASNGTGAELLSDFIPVGDGLPNARIGRINGQASCNANSPSSNFDFGASFASIFGPTNTGDLNPVVPTMRGGVPNCSGEPRSFLVDDREVSLWEVLAFPGDVSAALGEFASIVAAAYFNALAYPRYPVTVGQIVHMWNDGVTGGYCPSSGCTDGHVWDKDRIMEYLTSTFESLV